MLIICAWVGAALAVGALAVAAAAAWLWVAELARCLDLRRRPE